MIAIKINDKIIYHLLDKYTPNDLSAEKKIVKISHVFKDGDGLFAKKLSFSFDCGASQKINYSRIT